MASSLDTMHIGVPNLRRVSFSDNPPKVVEVHTEHDACSHNIVMEDTVALPGQTFPLLGENGKSLSASLAVYLKEQRALRSRLGRAEAYKAQLWERLKDIERSVGLARDSRRPRREQKVSFTQEPKFIPDVENFPVIEILEVDANHAQWMVETERALLAVQSLSGHDVFEKHGVSGRGDME